MKSRKAKQTKFHQESGGKYLSPEKKSLPWRVVSDQIKWQQIVSIYKGESNQLYSCNTNRCLPNSMFPIYFYRTTLENIQSISMYILHFPSKSNLTKQVWYWDIKAAYFIYFHSGRWVIQLQTRAIQMYVIVKLLSYITLFLVGRFTKSQWIYSTIYYTGLTFPVHLGCEIFLSYEIWIYHVQLLNCEV